uniref:Uncharacterized protein n=1 Tax=Cyclopterus lumpus TaxID=8103 RepID=A0A8C2X087_CYCLU
MYLVFSICLYLPGVGVMFVALIVPGGCYHSLVFPWHWYLMERDRRVSATGGVRSLHATQ